MKIGADGEELCIDVMKINRPDDLGDVANLGLTLAKEKLLLAGLQQEIVAAQAKGTRRLAVGLQKLWRRLPLCACSTGS
ncbi:MAG: hypothetical protein ACJ8AW_26405 [Rhodopila sp.]